MSMRKQIYKLADNLYCITNKIITVEIFYDPYKAYIVKT